MFMFKLRILCTDDNRGVCNLYISVVRICLSLFMVMDDILI